MAVITLSMPEDLKREMDSLKEMNWSAVARAAIIAKIEELKLLKDITSKSKLSERDALELGRKINKSLHDRLAR